MRTRHPSLGGLSEDEFLTGSDPDGEVELDVDKIFGKKWNVVLSEMLRFDPQGLCIDESSVESESGLVKGYRFRPVESGVLLIGPDGDSVGGYLSCDISIDPAHQGQGLGAELIMERYLRDGSLPTWSLDVPAYSPDGVRAHRSAYRLFHKRPDLVDSKIAVIDGAGLDDLSKLNVTIEIDGVRRPCYDANGRLIGGGDKDKQRAFWEWAGDTKAVDEAGCPLMLFHGSIIRESKAVPGMGNIREFDRLLTTKFRGHSLDTVGSWFSSNPGEGGAGMYAGMHSGSVIYPVYLSIKSPQETTFSLFERRARLLANGEDDGRKLGKPEVDAYRKWLKEMGKDGIKIVHDEYNDRGSTEFKQQVAWIALEANQIKSATGNPGSYARNSACIVDGHGLEPEVRKKLLDIGEDRDVGGEMKRRKGMRP